VRVLIRCDAAINKVDNKGNTPVTHVSWGGDSEMVRLLLGLGADVRVNVPGLGPALAIAAKRGHAGAVSRLAGWR
jgi:ankyrin repeat protein